MSEPMDVDTPGSDESGEDDEDTRIIFHPPRGERLPDGKRTSCINHLYEHATAARREAKREARDETHMRYEFPVTTEWYDIQRYEGRGFEHVHVAPWESVFSLLQIQSTGTTRASNAGQENTPSIQSASFDKVMKG
jgi:chromo domain-containing protein 1